MAYSVVLRHKETGRKVYVPFSDVSDDARIKRVRIAGALDYELIDGNHAHDILPGDEAIADVVPIGSYMGMVLRE